MRNLTLLVLFLTAIYSGYWFIGANSVENAAETALADLRSSGWQADYSDVKTRGYPNRFDTTIKDISVTDPQNAWRYEAPFVQALALSYAPNKIIAVLPQVQTITLPDQVLTITTESIRASTSVAANTSLTFQGFTAEVAPTTLASTLGWDMMLTKALAAMRPLEARETGYEIYFEANDLTVSGVTPMQQASLAAMVTFDKPLDRNSMMSATANPIRITDIDITALSLNWGEMTVRGTGALTVDQGGVASGDVTFTLSNWQQTLSTLANMGVIDPDVLPTLLGMGATMASADGTLNLPIKIQNGLMFIGFIPLGYAPTFN